MPARQELIQEITVNGEIQMKGSTAIMVDLSSKVEQCLEEAVKTSGMKIAEQGKEDQEYGITYFNAICTGGLVNSITINGGGGGMSSKYQVNTSKEGKEPVYLIKGRGAVHAKNAPCLVYHPKCNPNRTIFTKSVGAAEPRDYMRVADEQLSNEYKEIAESVVQSAFSVL